MDWERWYTQDPKGIPSDEAFEYYNLAISLGYKEYLQKEFGRSLYYYNQDYRSPPNMKHAKDYAIANELNNQTVVTPISDIPVTTSPQITLSEINNDEIPQGYHKMPDGTIMKDSEHKTEREKLVEKSSVAILVIGGIGLYLALRFK